MKRTDLIWPAALLLASCSPSAPPAATPEPVVVRTVAVVTAPDRETLTISGSLVSETEARLSFKTGGIIQEMPVKEGDSVRRGQLLARLNLTEIDAQVAQAQEGLTKAKRDLDRTKDLFTQSVATQEQLDNATTAFQLATRSVEIAQYNRSYSEIRAPEDGFVLHRQMSEGELASPGATVFVVGGSAAGDWVLRCGVSDRVWARLTRGDIAQVSLDAYPGEPFAATLTRLSQGAETSGLYQVDLKLKPGKRPFASGLFGRAQISVAAAGRGLTVPIDALVRGQGDEAHVFVDIASKAEERQVRVVSWNDTSAVVAGNLGVGLRVVVEGAAWLAPGTSLRIAE
jgi:RND family efflux transporter MFP subunit